MSRKKTVAVALVLALVLIIGGMLAYFTDTDTKTNVFTLGDEVEISLSEDGWDALTDSNNNDIPDIAEGIHPGTKVVKDPVITNESETTPAYVFAEIIVPCYDADDDGTADTPLYKLLNSSDVALTMTQGSSGNTGWTLINSPSVNTTDNTITYVYAYGTSSAMTSLAGTTPNASTSTPVFSKVQVVPDLTSDQAATASNTPNIVVNAYGIQTDGLSVTTPSAIYDLF